jgi:hypothetical protein
MPKRDKRRKDRNEQTRTERKLRFIRAKNLMTQYPDCAHGGAFYCNHVYDPKHPWCWVDFRFFHTRLKKYYAVAMVTAEYEAYCNVEEVAWETAELQIPRSHQEGFGDLIENEDGTHTLEMAAFDNERYAIQGRVKQSLIGKTQMVSPSIKLVDYGPVAIGVHATISRPYIDEHFIRDFITFFRMLGEPTTPGWEWRGEEVAVVPSRLDERNAES